MALSECVIGSDHGGVLLCNALVEHLNARNVKVRARFGPADPATRADYPDVAGEVCAEVKAAASPNLFGLLLCGTGQGMAMSANRIPGIRAGVVLDAFSAQMLRAHNNANVLCLGERVVGVSLARLLLDNFLETPFEGGRHAGRVEKMMAIQG